MPVSLTLRFRIISLVTLFAILLISAFSALLVTRHLRIITENNLYRARIGTFAAKGAFERALLSNLRTGDPAKAFEKLIPLLSEGQLVEQVSVADLTGKVIASTEDFEVGSRLSDRDFQSVQVARERYSPQTWFHALVAPGEVAFYAPIALDDIPQYVATFRYSLGNMPEAIRQVGSLCALVALGVVSVVVPLCLLLIQAILGPIRLLNRATKDVSAGNLSLQVRVLTQDELGELAETFNRMTSTLVQMKERAENANPLTKLPGNNVIHAEIEKRIKAGSKFVAVYSDLDNFKAFNDKYGIGAGDQAIRLTAKILREAIRLGSPTDFLGHEGGDDFFLLTTPEKEQTVTDFITAEFDQRIRELYSPEDRQRGTILSKDREGNEKRFPIMTISLAGITNMRRKLTSYAEVTNICAEVKKKVKNLTKEGGKSCFYLDRRTGEERNPAPTTPNPEANA